MRVAGLDLTVVVGFVLVVFTGSLKAVLGGVNLDRVGPGDVVSNDSI